MIDTGLSRRLRQWPDDQLDVAGMRARGWRPTPFRDFVLKVHQRCNLACDYCYVYTMADQSWRHRPAVMAPQVGRATAERIAEHVRAHSLTDVRLILHGGEPLLAGVGYLLALVSDLRAPIPPECRVEVCVQTNGVLLDEATLRCPARARRRGRGQPRRYGQAQRPAPPSRRRPGQLSSGRARARLLGDARYRSTFAGLLCTIDPATDPVACYEGLLAHDPPAIDFLLPHANWSNPPHAPPGAGPTPYGDWLVAVFDRWYGAPRQETRVRLLEEIISLVLGGASRSEQVGLSPVGVVVVETDGAIEQVDSLKSAYAGACGTGLTVMADPFDAALDHPGVVARQIGPAALC